MQLKITIEIICSSNFLTQKQSAILAVTPINLPSHSVFVFARQNNNKTYKLNLKMVLNPCEISMDFTLLENSMISQ